MSTPLKKLKHSIHFPIKSSFQDIKEHCSNVDLKEYKGSFFYKKLLSQGKISKSKNPQYVLNTYWGIYDIIIKYNT